MTTTSKITVSDPRWARIRFWIRFAIRFLLDVVTHPASAAPWLKDALAQLRRYPYLGRRRMLRALGPDLGAMMTWSAVDTEVQGEMAEVFNRTPRVNMFVHYFSIYESLVDRTKPIRMLQIGSFYGGSLEMWREYLHPDSLLVCVDVYSKLLKVADAGGVHVRMAGEQDASFLSAVAAEFGPFDLIVDSGMRTSSHMVECFRRLFANALNDNGIYVVENVACDYWMRYRDRHVSFIDFVRALIDAMHGHYQAATAETKFRLGHSDRLRELTVPAITPILGGIEIYDSVVVVRRTARDLAQSIYRS